MIDAALAARDAQARAEEREATLRWKYAAEQLHALIWQKGNWSAAEMTAMAAYEAARDGYTVEGARRTP